MTSDCPRCGHPLDPDAASCFACAQGEPPMLRLPAQPSAGKLTWVDQFRGAAVGAAIGSLAWVVAVLTFPPAVGGPNFIVPIPVTIAGGLLGALAVVLWKGLLRPVLLALLASPEAFEREYGTPPRQRIVRDGEPPRLSLSGTAFRRNPTWGWLFWGAFFGAALGSVVGATVALVSIATGGTWAGRPGEGLFWLSLIGVAVGGAAGALGAAFWMGVGRPVWLALFRSEAFQREYGTLEERGIVRRTRE